MKWMVNARLTPFQQAYIQALVFHGSPDSQSMKQDLVIKKKEKNHKAHKILGKNGMPIAENMLRLTC